MHPLPALRTWGLEQAARLGMDLPFALRLMESGLPPCAEKTVVSPWNQLSVPIGLLLFAWIHPLGGNVAMLVNPSAKVQTGGGGVEVGPVQ